VLLLLLKAISSLAGVVQPIAGLLPDWLPADQLLSLLLVLIVCVIVGYGAHPQIGEKVWRSLEGPLVRKKTPGQRESLLKPVS
jgi:hypothetical protein